MVWYLAWRAMHSLHSEISLNFLVAGHTKFAPDWCFGLMKQRYRRSHVSDLNDIKRVVSESTISGLNVPQLVEKEDGEVFVQQYNWQAFLSPYFKTLEGIKSLHHLRLVSIYDEVLFFISF